MADESALDEGIRDKTAPRTAALLQADAARGTAVLHHAVQAVPGLVGRAEELAAVEKALWGDDGGATAAPITATAVVAVHGPGGAGKSALARQYAWYSRARYRGVWWLRAARETTLAEDLIQLGARSGVGPARMQERNRAARRALDGLEQNQSGRPWLLVYDDADAPGRIAGDLMPRAGAHVLITTRRSGGGAAAASVPVGVLPADAAVAYLLEQTNRTDRAGAAGLAAVLGHLPLALEHAAVYCRRTGMDFAAYRKLAGDLLQQAPEAADDATPVRATFALAVARAAKICPASEKLLGLAAFLGPERIPLSLFTSDVLAEAERAEAVAALTDLSLVVSDPLGDGAPGIGVQRLVQAAMRRRLGDMGEHDNAARLAAELAADASPPVGDLGPDVVGAGSELLADATAASGHTGVALGWQSGDGPSGPQSVLAPVPDPGPASTTPAPAMADADATPDAEPAPAPTADATVSDPEALPPPAGKATFLNWMFGRL